MISEYGDTVVSILNKATDHSFRMGFFFSKFSSFSRLVTFRVSYLFHIKRNTNGLFEEFIELNLGWFFLKEYETYLETDVI